MMPWEDTFTAYNAADTIPAGIRRDANNRAPFMEIVVPTPWLYEPSPANNPPETAPNWVPPWTK